jgi:hypothetical protein
MVRARLRRTTSLLRIGGMVALIVRKVEEGKGERLPDLLPDLVELFLAPYVVRSEAIRLARSPL